MNLFIPEIGTKLKLTKAWNIELEWESRNMTMIKTLHPKLVLPYHEAVYVANNPHLWVSDGYTALGMTQEQYHGDHQCNGNTRSQESKDRWAKAETWYRDRRREKRQAYVAFRDIHPLTVSFPKGTVLEIDRIYIRQGKTEYSSVTFKIRGAKVLRFWAKLDDVNRIQCQVLEETTERASHTAGGGANCFHG